MRLQFGTITSVGDLGSLTQYIRNQLTYLTKYLNDGADDLKLKVTYKEPDNVRDGLVVLADGTHWNPGSGQGYYGYYGGAWHKLG